VSRGTQGIPPLEIRFPREEIHIEISIIQQERGRLPGIFIFISAQNEEEIRDIHEDYQPIRYPRGYPRRLRLHSRLAAVWAGTWHSKFRRVNGTCKSGPLFGVSRVCLRRFPVRNLLKNWEILSVKKSSIFGMLFEYHVDSWNGEKKRI
jgi:hypothetical protein